MSSKRTFKDRTCQQCGIVTKGSAKRKFCEECKPFMKLVRKRIAYAALHPPVQKVCEGCSSILIGVDPRRRFCFTCVEKKRADHRMSQYGITYDDVERMKRTQNDCCAICGIHPKETLHVDHDHLTGKVRGLLCCDCNTALGRVKDNITTVLAMVKYLVKAQE